ncbi:MAG TPA: 1,2-phenylacetyl-CoA epoxidase subunit PaaD [Trebonia sp.]
MSAWETAASVLDPELPALTIADLGILRDVRESGGTVTVTITPTYSGCPAMAQIAADLRRRLGEAGYRDVAVRTELSPAWTTDWITPDGRRKLAEAGIAPPGAPGARPVLVQLTVVQLTVRCQRCGSADTREISRFSGTACKALRQCRACLEPFEHVKEH